jgi:geranylgeranyl reductase family protein
MIPHIRVWRQPRTVDADSHLEDKYTVPSRMTNAESRRITTSSSSTQSGTTAAVSSPDVIVVGAGPAGSTAAMILARAGIRVLLLDKARFPRDKICGDAVGLDGVRVLRRLGLMERIRAARAIAVRGVLVTSPKGACATIRLPEERVKEIGFILPRLVLDHLLLEAAVEAGAQLREGFNVEAPLFSDGAVVGIKGTHNGQSVTLRAPLTIAADGAHSVFARHILLRRKSADARVFALRSYYRGVHGVGDNIEIHYMADSLPAFGWIFPTGGDTANVGVGVWGGRDASRNIRLVLDSFLHRCVPARERLRDAIAEAPLQGWPLDLGEGAWRASAGGLLAVGDAASFIDPLTGEGIGTAMVSSELAAATALEALTARDFSARFLGRYDTAWRWRLGTDFVGGLLLKKIMSHKHAAELIIGRASRDEIIGALWGGLIAGALPKWMFLNPVILARFVLGRALPFPRLQARGR